MRFIPIVLLSALALLAHPAHGGPLDRQSAEPRRNPASDSMLRVPGVLGMCYTEAAMVLQQAGLVPRPARIEKENSEYRGQEGLVVRQIPAAGGVAMLGSSVTVEVYAPPQTESASPWNPSDPWSADSGGGYPAPGASHGDQSPPADDWGWNPAPDSPAETSDPPAEPYSGWQSDNYADGDGASVPPSENYSSDSNPTTEQEQPSGGNQPPAVIVAQPVPVTVQLADSGQQASRARYRIVATGFQVNQETWDHALNADGCGDEIVVHGAALEVDNDGKVLKRTLRHTSEMGDINHFTGRVRAGKGECFSLDPPKGGLKTGDRFPLSDPSQLWDLPRNDRLPLALWEGELVDGENAVLVFPTVWEYDSKNDLVKKYENIFKKTAVKIAESQPGQFVSWLGSRLEVGAESFGFSLDNLRMGVETLKKSVENTVGKAAHRPIGMTKQGSDYVPASPKAISLTYHRAEELLRTQQGQLSRRFRDHPDLKGDYNLYLVLERI